MVKRIVIVILSILLIGVFGSGNATAAPESGRIAKHAATTKAKPTANKLPKRWSDRADGFKAYNKFNGGANNGCLDDFETSYNGLVKKGGRAYKWAVKHDNEPVITKKYPGYVHLIAGRNENSIPCFLS